MLKHSNINIHQKLSPEARHRCSPILFVRFLSTLESAIFYCTTVDFYSTSTPYYHCSDTYSCIRGTFKARFRSIIHTRGVFILWCCRTKRSIGSLALSSQARIGAPVYAEKTVFTCHAYSPSPSLSLSLIRSLTHSLSLFVVRHATQAELERRREKSGANCAARNAQWHTFAGRYKTRPRR